MRVALFYFVYLLATGILLPFFPPYLKALQFDDTQVGWLCAIQPALLAFVPLIWGFAADRTGKTATMLKITTAGVVVSLSLLFWARSYGAVLGVCVAYSFFVSAIIPLADTLAIVEARRMGTEYARLRLWGSISYILAAFGFSMFLARGGSILAVPAAAVSAAILGALCAQWLRNSQGVPRVPPSIADARRLLGDRSLLFFLIAGLFHQAAVSPYAIFYAIHLKNTGIGAEYVGWSTVCGVSAEIVMFWFIGTILKKQPLFPLMAASFVIGIARWWLVARARDPVWMSLLQMAHAFTFALCYAGSVAHIEKAVPAALRGTGRALYSALSQGAGAVGGHILSGYIVTRHGSAAAFQMAAVLECVALLPLGLSAWYEGRRSLRETLQPTATMYDSPLPPVADDV